MIIAIYLTFINLYAFIVYGIDKRKAIKNGKKESERVPSVSVRGKSGPGRRGRSGSWSGEGDRGSSGVRPGGRSHTGRSAVRRIPESTLIALAVIGGGPGALLGMTVFRHKTQKKKFTRTVPALAAFWLIFMGFCLYQNFHLTVTEYKYEADAECTIVQISDLHNQFFGFNEGALLKKIKKCEPDMILVTGDVVDSGKTDLRLAKAFFTGAVKIAPVYYVSGNHDYALMEECVRDAYGEKKMYDFISAADAGLMNAIVGDEKCVKQSFGAFLKDIQDAGVVLLDGKTAEFGDGIILAGAYDNSNLAEYGWEDDPRLKILLSHDPGMAESYKQSGADLVFAGHYHGGQIVIPGKGGLLSPNLTFYPKYCGGEYDLGSASMIVSRGLGNSALPLRINNYPEIVVVKVGKTE